MLKPISPASPRKPRHTLDRLLDRALGPRPPPAPLALLPDELSTRAVRASGQDQDLYGDGGGPTREPATPFYSPVEPDFPISLHDVSLDSVWEEVQSAKARALVGAPSKVRSLEGAGSLGGQTAVQAPDDGGYGGGREKDAGGRRRRVTRRRSRCVRPGGALLVRGIWVSRHEDRVGVRQRELPGVGRREKCTSSFAPCVFCAFPALRPAPAADRGARGETRRGDPG